MSEYLTIQETIRTPEIKSAIIVYEKYKRKMHLDHPDLMRLSRYILAFSENRAAQGKQTSKELLTQECSAEVKRWGENMNYTDENRLNWIEANNIDIEAPAGNSTWVIYSPKDFLGEGIGYAHKLRDAIDLAMEKQL